jgi:formylglycine-generating enzyme required for sulfatase activity
MASQNNKRSLVLVRIPAGEFVMGSPVGHGDTDEFPQHDVFVEDFLISNHLVTAAEWAVFLNEVKVDAAADYFESSEETTVALLSGRFYVRRGCMDYPANAVTWYGANAYCEWLSEKTGKQYHLPTEAQWEKAARAGLKSKYYPWGNEDADGKAQFQQVWTAPHLTLSAVGSYPPNGYGLYDMAGNVWEWCADWYDRSYYHDSPYENPTGPETGDLKVLRGGSWGGLDLQIRCGIRVGERPDVAESRVGFRVAREP